MINRSVLTVRAKKPFLDWINSLPDPAKVSAAQINRDNTAYLLPDLTYHDDQEDVLEIFYEFIFQEQLSRWWSDESAWPKSREFNVFKTWFDVEFHSAVLDLVDAPLEDDE